MQRRLNDPVRWAFAAFVAIAALASLVLAVRGESIGLIANAPAAATANTLRWTRAWAANPPKTVTLPIGTVYINGVISTRPVVGCGRIATDGCGGYPVDGHPTLTGARVRLVQLGKGPCLRICGVGFLSLDPIELVGDGVSAAIEIEGRAHPATGRHEFARITFQNWGRAFDLLAGYYEGDKFNKDENHADNCVVTRCETFNVGTFVRSLNEQAVNWGFRDCIVNDLRGPAVCVVADIVRGGNMHFDRLIINCPRTIHWRLRDYSPNTCRLVSRDFERDRFPEIDFPGNYLRLVENAGDPNAAHRLELEMTGKVNTHHAPLDPAMAFQGCERLDKSRWKIDVPDYVTLTPNTRHPTPDP